MPPRPVSTAPTQTPEAIAAALEAFVAEYPAAALLEDGKILFDLRTARYTFSTEHNRCTLHVWDDEGAGRTLVRRVIQIDQRKAVLKLTTQRFGQTKPQVLELTADRDRRTASSREATRTRFLRVLERALVRHFPEWKQTAFRTAMDLEKSFGPAYARGTLVKGQHAWAVIAVNDEEQPGTIDGILTLGILWLTHCRERAGGRRLYQGLRLILPKGAATLTLSRIAWLSMEVAKYELYEFDQKTESLELRDPADHGNLHTHLHHAPNHASARERFAESTVRVLSLIPPERHEHIEQRLRTGSELAFLLHGLEFARIRVGSSANSFNREHQVSFGSGPNETILTSETAPALRSLIEGLFTRRHASGDHRDPLFRTASERWLESSLRRDLTQLAAHDLKLRPEYVYSQVPAFAAADRGMIDLLGVTEDGRLSVLELKAEEDLQMALQGLDYWIRVRYHHLQHADQITGLGEFQRHGYFGGIPLSRLAPRLYLVAPALRIHPANEIVLRHLNPVIEWTLIALDERWRMTIKPVWRKRSSDRA